MLEHQGEHPSQWAAIESIAAKIGCTAETLRHWARRAERDAHLRPGLTTDERQRLKDLGRENRELKRGERDPEAGVGIFREGRARPPSQVMVRFIDEHRTTFGVATLEWVAWYNHRRLLEPLGYVPPAEFEQAYYDRRATPGAMAVLTVSGNPGAVHQRRRRSLW